MAPDHMILSSIFLRIFSFRVNLVKASAVVDGTSERISTVCMLPS